MAIAVLIAERTSTPAAVSAPPADPLPASDDAALRDSSAPCGSAPSDLVAEALLDPVLHDITELFLAYAGAIHTYAAHLLGSTHDADDVTQETFIRAAAHLDRLRDPSGVRRWLYRIATNLCMDALRRAGRRRKYTGVALSCIFGSADGREHDVAIPEPAAPLALAAVESVAEREHIRQALRAMPPHYAACLLLYAEQGMSYREIADTLGITHGAAAVRLSRARAAFVRHYRRLAGDDGDHHN